MAKSSPLLKLEEKVHQAITARNLLCLGDRIVVAVSGGPDSVALLACLVALAPRWKWTISIGHINHGLRGTESEEDAAFVEQLGTALTVPVFIRTPRLCKQEVRSSKQSLQAYAREVRYQALEDIVQESGATKIATGHTADDQAETVLMWMIRGSGSGGLSGIPPTRGGRIVRPILNFPRREIVNYLDQRQLTYRVDSSNNQTTYLRNRIRKNLMPQLQDYAPGLVSVLSRQAEIIREDHIYLEHVAAKALQDIGEDKGKLEIQIDRAALLVLPLAIQRRVVQQGLKQLNGTHQSPRFDLIQRLLDLLARGQTGWKLHIHSVHVTQEYEWLVFSKRETMGPKPLGVFQENEIAVDVPGEVIWPLTGQQLMLAVRHTHEVTFSSGAAQMHLDADTFTPELRIRTWQPGDVFRPKGMGGRQKKLQDFFTDMKLPRSQRETLPLLVAPEGILLVGGMRMDERFQVSSATTSVVIATLTS